MIDKEKYPELYKATESIITLRQQWLDDAIKTRELCELLPDEIKALHIRGVDSTCDKLSVDIVNKDGTIQILKLLGIQGLKTQISSWNKEQFYSRGDGVLSNGSEFSVHISNVDKPEGCRVEEKTVTRTENVLVCEQTGQPV